MTQMDPLVALFREQVALLQQQAKVLEQQAAALAGKGTVLPQLPTLAQVSPLPASPPVAAVAQPAPARLAAVAAVPKGADERVAKTILASVARISAFPQEAIKPSQTLAGDLGFDSLMTVELDSDVNKAFPGAGGLPRTLLGPQTTVQQVIEHLERAVAQPHAPAAPVLSPILGEVASEGRELLPFSPTFAKAPLAARPAEDPTPKRLLLTRDSLGVADALAKLLEEAGHDAVVGPWRSPFMKSTTRWSASLRTRSLEPTASCISPRSRAESGSSCLDSRPCSRPIGSRGPRRRPEREGCSSWPPPAWTSWTPRSPGTRRRWRASALTSW